MQPRPSGDIYRRRRLVFRFLNEFTRSQSSHCWNKSDAGTLRRLHVGYVRYTTLHLRSMYSDIDSIWLSSTTWSFSVTCRPYVSICLSILSVCLFACKLRNCLRPHHNAEWMFLTFYHQTPPDHFQPTCLRTRGFICIHRGPLSRLVSPPFNRSIVHGIYNIYS